MQAAPSSIPTSGTFFLLPPKPKSTFRHLKQGIQDFHGKNVLVPADKTANKIVVVWRLHCINTLKQELSWTKAYKETSEEEKSVVNGHCNHLALKFSVCVKERQDRLFVCCLAHRGSTSWFSFAPVFQWCCSTPQGSPGVGRNTFLSSPHLCFITVFIYDLFVSRDDPLMS